MATESTTSASAPAAEPAAAAPAAEPATAAPAAAPADEGSFSKKQPKSEDERLADVRRTRTFRQLSFLAEQDADGKSINPLDSPSAGEGLLARRNSKLPARRNSKLPGGPSAADLEANGSFSTGRKKSIVPERKKSIVPVPVPDAKFHDTSYEEIEEGMAYQSTRRRSLDEEDRAKAESTYVRTQATKRVNNMGRKNSEAGGRFEKRQTSRAQTMLKSLNELEQSLSAIIPRRGSQGERRRSSLLSILSMGSRRTSAVNARKSVTGEEKTRKSSLLSGVQKALSKQPKVLPSPTKDAAAANQAAAKRSSLQAKRALDGDGAKQALDGDGDSPVAKKPGLLQRIRKRLSSEWTEKSTRRASSEWVDTKEESSTASSKGSTGKPNSPPKIKGQSLNDAIDQLEER